MPRTVRLGKPTRSLENLLRRTDITPLRLYQVMWPVWQIEIEADSVDHENYDLLDRFVVRALAEGGYTRPSDIADLLGVSSALVEGACRFLARLGHVSIEDETVAVTEFGRESLATGQRLTRRTSRLFLLFDAITGQPLPRAYHRGELTYEPESTRSGWFSLAVREPFKTSSVSTLTTRSDRGSFNLPTHLERSRIHSQHLVYTAAHLIETRERGMLAFSEAAPEGDEIMRAACRRPWLQNLFLQMPTDEPEKVWIDWLHRKGVRATVAQRPDGIWRATLQASAFDERGSFKLSRLGAFEYEKRLFLQIWCDDPKVRRQALLTRLVAMHKKVIKNRDDLRRWIGDLCLLLELPTVAPEDLELWADGGGLNAEVRLMVRG